MHEQILEFVAIQHKFIEMLSLNFSYQGSITHYFFDLFDGLYGLGCWGLDCYRFFGYSYRIGNS